MADKDRSYDPQPEYDSGTEREDDYVSNNTHSDQEMNNTKVSSPTHPGSLTGAFVHNDIVSDCGEATENSGGWRRGGPLMNPGEKEKQDKPKQKPAAKPKKRCIKCDGVTEVYYQGTRFECDEWYADEPEQLKAHNKLCKECAMNERKCRKCPVHTDANYNDDADDIIPEVVPE